MIRTSSSVAYDLIFVVNIVEEIKARVGNGND